MRENIMKDYTKELPAHVEKYIGENDLFLEIYEGAAGNRPPLLFVHGAYTGSWMWSKYIPHFVEEDWKCYVMNMRSHYKSRVMDMTRVTAEDYMEDVREIIAECGEAPIVIGFSMGGIIVQKLAETEALAGLAIIDTSESGEVDKIVPRADGGGSRIEAVEPAPAREDTSIDESADDVAFQRKYLAMESSKAFAELGYYSCKVKRTSIDGSLITCPCLVIKAVNNADDERRGVATAEQLHAEYLGLRGATHTGLLVGQRYKEAVDRMLEWLKLWRIIAEG